DLVGELPRDRSLAALRANRERTAQRFGANKLDGPTRKEIQRRQVAEQLGVAVGNPLHGRSFPRREPAERLSFRMHDSKLRVGDRIAVRIVCRRAERLVDERLERFGESVLEAIGFGMNGVEPELERLGQVELEETVVTEQLECDALAVTGQPYAAIELMIDESERRELLHHRRRRGRSNAHLLRKRRGLDASALRLQLVDLAQVVLDRVAQIREDGLSCAFAPARCGVLPGSHVYATRRPVVYMTTMPAR